MKISNLEEGQSLFELVVAIAISALIIVVIVSLTTSSIRNSVFSKNNDLATTYAQQVSEWLRGQRDDDLDAFETNAALPAAIDPKTSLVSWCFKDLTWATDNEGPCSNTDFVTGTSFFIRQAAFSVDANTGIVHVDIDVSWIDSQGTHDVRNSTELSGLR